MPVDTRRAHRLSVPPSRVTKRGDVALTQPREFESLRDRDSRILKNLRLQEFQSQCGIMSQVFGHPRATASASSTTARTVLRITSQQGRTNGDPPLFFEIDLSAAASLQCYRAGAAGNFLAPITQLSANAFKAVIDIDVLGSYNTVKATLPYLVASAEKAKADNTPGPRILFVSATIHYTGLPLQTHVGSAKAAVDSLSNSLAIEMGPRGITSNIIAPGGIAGTEGVERLMRQDDLEMHNKRNPMGRLGTIKDVADTTIWICGPSAGFINGTTIVGELSLHFRKQRHG